MSIVSHILFSFSLLWNIEQSSLCYTIGPCWLSLLNSNVYMSVPNSHNITFFFISLILFCFSFFLLVWQSCITFIFFQMFSHIYSYICIDIWIHIYHNNLLKQIICEVSFRIWHNKENVIFWFQTESILSNILMTNHLEF